MDYLLILCPVYGLVKGVHFWGLQVTTFKNCCKILLNLYAHSLDNIIRICMLTI